MRAHAGGPVVDRARSVESIRREVLDDGHVAIGEHAVDVGRVERFDEARDAFGQREHLRVRAIGGASGRRYDRRAHREAPHQGGE